MNCCVRVCNPPRLVMCEEFKNMHYTNNGIEGLIFFLIFPEHTPGQHLKIGEIHILSSHFKSTKYNNLIVSFDAIQGMQLIQLLNYL
jgi:hypothetical protein